MWRQAEEVPPPDLERALADCDADDRREQTAVDDEVRRRHQRERDEERARPRRRVKAAAAPGPPRRTACRTARPHSVRLPKLKMVCARRAAAHDSTSASTASVTAPVSGPKSSRQEKANDLRDRERRVDDGTFSIRRPAANVIAENATHSSGTVMPLRRSRLTPSAAAPQTPTAATRAWTRPGNGGCAAARHGLRQCRASGTTPVPQTRYSPEVSAVPQTRYSPSGDCTALPHTR